MLLTYPTAYTFWMHYGSLDPQGRPHKPEIESYPKPLHAFVSNAALRKHTSDVVSHVIPKGLSQNAFRHISQGYSVIEPELCFLLAAKTLSIPELVLLANNLCGIFCLDEKTNSGFGKREAITSVQSIKQYLENVKNVDGIKKARTAIQYACDGSGSPMESRIAAIGRLPFHLGGYGLSGFSLNCNVSLSSDGQRILHREFCCCDMVWPKEKVIVEYDSDQFHMQKDQFYYDKRRSSALNISGYQVVHITKVQLQTYSGIEDLFLAIRKTLGVRTRMERLGKYREKRDQAIRVLFFMHHSFL